MEHTGHLNILSLPRDRATINAWLRSAALQYPIIHNTVNFHVANITSGICITSNDKKLDLFAKQIQRALPYVIHDLVLLGECFPFLVIRDNVCQSIKVKDPDYIVVKRNAVGNPTISERPSENLRRLVKEHGAVNEDMLNEDIYVENVEVIIHAINSGANLSIDPACIWHLKLLSSPREIRGTSYLLPIITELQNDKSLDSTETKHTILYPFDNPEPAIIRMTKLFYDRVWDQLEPWVEHCFSFISKLNDWYVYVDGEKKPLMPEIAFYNPALTRQ